MGGHVVTAEIPAAADRAINEVLRAHKDELAAALKPFDLTIADVVLPRWRRIVYEDEILR